MVTSFYSQDELKNIGLKQVGDNVYISRKASFYSPEKITIGNNVRIDDYCILSGDINLGNYIHIAAYTALFAGSYKIKLKDFCTLSSRVAIYAESDDYSGASLSNPLIDYPYRKTYGGDVVLNKHVLIGTNSTILPSVVLDEGVSVGAYSLVKENLLGWTLYGGIPAKKLRDRDKEIKKIEKNYIDNIQ